MNKTMKISFVLFAGLLIAGCAMRGDSMGGLMSKTKTFLTDERTSAVPIIYSNEPGQEFISGVEDMALGLLTCDAVTKALKPPLIVIRPLEAEGEVSFDTTKYAETERNILVGKAGDKVRFIDKETTEEANYYLYGVISQASAPPSNDNRNDIRRKRSSMQSAPNYLEQTAANNQATTSNKAYRFIMTLIDPRSNTTIWKDECGFTPKEMPHSKQRYK